MRALRLFDVARPRPAPGIRLAEASRGMNEPSLHEVYERWAPLYPARPHNPLMQAEQAAMLERLPPTHGRCVLDLACGSGRYAAQALQRGAARIVAVDFSLAMLRQVSAGEALRGELDALPLRDAQFDLVISGLALGHASDLSACMREIARVLKPGGTLLYSDFHPEAQRRGQTRSFRDARGERFTVPPAHFDREAHLHAIRGAALEIIEVFEPRTGVEFLPEYPQASSFFQDWRGTPMLLIIQARKL
jgi:malonyl-CoA O-methyltransferase